MINKFIFNETSYFGWGSRKVLSDEISKRGYKKALVVTDKEMVKVGIASKITDLLDSNNISYEIFNDVVPNPTINNVKKGLKKANKYHVDFIIAVGGGSVIDTAKAIGIIVSNPEYRDVKSLCGIVDTKYKSLPIIAIPTTAGTAAEVTINYVITDEEEKTKMVCIDPNDIPVLSIVDTELMAGMPASLAASTGMDALTQAIECYITKGHNEMSDMFALKAINLIYTNLEKSINKEQDAMEKMALAQYIAGLGFSNVGLGIVHSMAHQLGALYNTLDGVANAIILPFALEYNGVECKDRFVDIAYAMGLDVDSADVVSLVVDSIKELNSRLNIPKSIKEVGAKKEDIPLLAKKALEDPCTSGNPREMTVLDFECLFEKMM